MMNSQLKWTLFLSIIAMGNICLAGKVQRAISGIENPDLEKCDVYEAQNISSALHIPQTCCADFTGQCYKEHNGRCMLKWLTGFCDYTIDVCTHNNMQSWYCTCCGSCNERNTNSHCKQNGGRCSRTCGRSQYHAWWIPCHHECCKCCKDICEESTCASGRGYCSPTSQCRRGYYPSSSDYCKGFGCTCCLPCNESKSCSSKDGFCDWKDRSCPTGYYSSDRLCCRKPECRCCHRQRILSDVEELCLVAAIEN
ncbi:multiple epidermal growth factor-like domains protein 11 [Palaemon carinicauda]|uniref:multiple epidermal growth factor-like domains protein 11 n=1 Tax=Palaemon carinicauda TaxID=392227 RepID=UPI0035B5A137